VTTWDENAGEPGVLTEPTMIPYGSTGSGHAGNDTSRERQERNDASGVTSRAQLAALKLLMEYKSEGITAAEFEDQMGIGHGMASSALSHLHRANRVKRVKMRRKRHEIYVLPEYVNGREESPYRPRLKPARHPRELSRERLLGIMMDAGVDESFYPEVRKVIEALP
jgi:ribosomal protein S25